MISSCLTAWLHLHQLDKFYMLRIWISHTLVPFHYLDQRTNICMNLFSLRCIQHELDLLVTGDYICTKTTGRRMRLWHSSHKSRYQIQKETFVICLVVGCKAILSYEWSFIIWVTVTEHHWDPIIKYNELDKRQIEASS